MASSILAVLAALLPLMVAVMEAYYGRKKRQRETHAKLAKHSLDELRAGAERVQPVPPHHPPM